MLSRIFSDDKFAVLLLWYRRDMAHEWNAGGSLWGVPLVVAAIAMRCASAYMSDPVFGPLSIAPCLAGVVLLVGGWGALRWTWPSIVCLLFMIPLPSFLATWGNLHLQRLATVCSTYLLQTIGVPSVDYGNVIVMADGELNIAEACAGLRSTMLFLAVSVGASFLVTGIPEKIAVVLSAIPATIVANVIRIAVTGLVHEYASKDLAETLFHDVFGFVMLPLAAGMIYAEVALIRWLLVTKEYAGPLPADLRHQTL